LKTQLILGPPGTGKTTKLLEIMEQEIENGVDPDRIAFCSFTRKAAHEAAERACEKFNFSAKDLPYFRTLHSLAFMLLGLRQNEVLQTKHLKEIGAALNIPFSNFQGVEEGLPNGRHPGDQYMFIEGYARARTMCPEEAWRNLDGYMDINWHEFQAFRSTLKDFKTENKLFDFADMIEMCDCPLDVDVVILDEAQDLSTAQWHFVRRVFAGARRMYIAGDDDQAIYQWSGADVAEFLNVDAEQICLSQSHRIPKSVHTVANSIAGKIRNRYHKEYYPRSTPGSVDHYPALGTVDISSGEWLLLCRNNFQIQQLVSFVREEGFTYSVRGESGLNQTHLQAIKLWERHRKGAYLTDDEWDTVKPFLPPRCKELPTEIWHQALTRIPLDDREWYLRLLQKGEKLTAKPRFNISTIHGIKGGEAQNVLLLTDMTTKIRQTMEIDADSEHRVWYVGVTRAKEALHIIAPENTNGYEI